METPGFPGFLPYTEVKRVEAQPLLQPGPCNLTIQASAGIRAWCRPESPPTESTLERQRSGREASCSSSLADGRLDIGIHLPLLGRRYQYLSLLGEGTSAQVVLALDTLRPSKDMVAIKILKRQFSYAGQKEARALRWLAGLAPQAAVVQLRDTFVHANHVCLVMPQLHNSLLDLIVHSADWETSVLVSQTRDMVAHLLATLADLHAHGLVHADLKPENILLSTPVDLGSPGCFARGMRLIDFGTCFSMTVMDTAQLSFQAQSLPYRAPEVLLQQPCGPPMDMWSLGCILAELLLLQPLFPADTPTQLLQQITDTIDDGRPIVKTPARPMSDGRLLPSKVLVSSWLDQVSPLHVALARRDRNAADLVMRLLAKDPACRLTAADALRHPFLSPGLPFRHYSRPQQPAPQPAPPPEAGPQQEGSAAAKIGDLMRHTHDALPEEAAPSAEKPTATCNSHQGLFEAPGRPVPHKGSFRLYVGVDCRGQASESQGLAGAEVRLSGSASPFHLHDSSRPAESHEHDSASSRRMVSSQPSSTPKKICDAAEQLHTAATAINERRQSVPHVSPAASLGQKADVRSASDCSRKGSPDAASPSGFSDEGEAEACKQVCCSDTVPGSACTGARNDLLDGSAPCGLGLNTGSTVHIELVRESTPDKRDKPKRKVSAFSDSEQATLQRPRRARLSKPAKPWWEV